jgi:5'(3')-deoxyribonucleotidase
VNQKIFLIDCDEILADFSKAVIALATHTFGSEMPEIPDNEWDIFNAFDDEQKAFLDDRISRKGFCADLPICDGAQQGVQRIRNTGCELVCVTTPWKSPTWAYERQLWLTEHFNLDRDHTVFTKRKDLVRGDFFLDDRPKHVLAHPDLAMLWSTPYNKTPAACAENDPRIDFYRRCTYHRVNGWDQVIHRVERRL